MLSTVISGIIALLLLAGLSVLIVLSLRRQKVLNTQYKNTTGALRALRSVLNSAAEGRPFATVPEEEQPELEALLDQCEALALQIDQASGRHNAATQVAGLVYRLSQQLGQSHPESRLHYAAGLIYDIGLLDIDPRILTAGKIREDQFDSLKTHTKSGLARLNFVPADWQPLFRQAVSMHHENLDGSGYPDRLTDSALPFVARAIRVAESYIALTSSRHYRKQRDSDSAIRELKQYPQHYDQVLVAALDTLI